MQNDDAIRLRHMLDAAQEARSFAKGRSRADLDPDRQLVLTHIPRPWSFKTLYSGPTPLSVL